MSAFDLTDAQKDKIAKTQGFVVYNPYVTVIPAYNLNAIQHYLLNNQDSIIELENNLKEEKEKIGSIDTDLKALKNNLENEINIDNIKEKVNHLETCVITYKGVVLNNEDGWSSENGLYTQEIKIEGIEKNDTPIVWLDLENRSPEEAQKMLEDWPLIGRIVAGDNSITAYCYEEKPETDIAIMIKVVRDTTMPPKED